jgi:hypothetical protein
MRGSGSPSADRGDMHIRVIWLLLGGGQQCTSVARARIGWFDRVRAYAQMGMLAGRVGRTITGPAGPRHRSIAAVLRLAEVQPAPRGLIHDVRVAAG